MLSTPYKLNNKKMNRCSLIEISNGTVRDLSVNDDVLRYFTDLPSFVNMGSKCNYESAHLDKTRCIVLLGISITDIQIENCIIVFVL